AAQRQLRRRRRRGRGQRSRADPRASRTGARSVRDSGARLVPLLGVHTSGRRCARDGRISRGTLGAASVAYRRMTTISTLFGGGTTSEYWLTRLLLQRGLAAIYGIAFLVAINQFRPLLGAHGLTPVPWMLQQTRFIDSPSLFFLHYSDAFAAVLSWSGLACALLAVTGVSERFGTPVSMVVWSWMWLAYLSIVNVGQSWYAFGWESL